MIKKLTFSDKKDQLHHFWKHCDETLKKANFLLKHIKNANLLKPAQTPFTTP